MNAMHTTTTATTVATKMRVEKIEITRLWAHGFDSCRYLASILKAGSEESLEAVGPALEADYPPIIVGPADADGEHELIDGYHRVAAAMADGCRKIWAIIVTDAELALLERMPEDDWIEYIQAAAEALED